jgi:hypothetical protein
MSEQYCYGFQDQYAGPSDQKVEKPIFEMIATELLIFTLITPAASAFSSRLTSFKIKSEIDEFPM